MNVFVLQLTERRPSLPGWVQVPIRVKHPLKGEPTILAVSAWKRGRTCVISALEKVALPDGSFAGPLLHLTVSKMGKEPRPTDVRAALRAFGMQGADEQKTKGGSRQFWAPTPTESAP